jgi:2-phosphosulfolactate phosphatase
MTIFKGLVKRTKLNIDMYLTPEDFSPEMLKGKISVVIDVLRATTTITTAFQNGCHQVIPVAEVETARKLAAVQSKETTLLCGERDGVKLPGFHLGNSPAEYLSDIVKNKTIIFTSTNGSRMLTQSRESVLTLVAAFVNVTKVVEYLLQQDQDVVILCAGRQNQFSLEDTVCGGMIIHQLYKTIPKKIRINDLVLSAMILYQKFENNILQMLSLSMHGRYLVKIGFNPDLVTCANVDSIALVPVFQKGVISLPKNDF